jgi:hypothetical protein
VEQIAMCVAEIVTGLSPLFTLEQQARGYVDCPNADIEVVLDKMIASGVW